MSDIKNGLPLIKFKVHTEEEDRKIQEMEERAEFEKCMQKFKSCGIGPSYYEYDLKSYETKYPAQAEILNKARDFFKHVIKGERTNMILTGTAGEGKTHVVVGLLKALCFTAKTEKINDFEVKGFYSVRYITSKDLCDSYARTQRFDSGYTTYSFYNDFVKSYDILAIDELGKATTKNEWEILFDILDKRMQAKKSTIIVSNIPYEQLNANLGDYGMSRLNIDGNLVKVDTTGLPDYRQQKK